MKTCGTVAHTHTKKIYVLIYLFIYDVVGVVYAYSYFCNLIIFIMGAIFGFDGAWIVAAREDLLVLVLR